MWKLLEKLKKLKPKKIDFKSFFCRYKITMNSNLFYQLNNVIGYDIKVIDDFISYKTTSKGIKRLKTSINIDNILIQDLLKEKYKFIIKNRIIMIFCLTIITIIFLTSNCFIREIIFSKPEYYDSEVYKVVHNHLIRVGPVYKLDENIKNINKELKISFPHYAYVGISKLGSKLMVDINLEDTPKKDNIINLEPGDMISKYDGYIIGIIAKKGVVTISTSQTIKKGNLLISGNLNFYNENKEPNYICPDGIILGKTVVYEKIIVKKEVKETIYNNKKNEYFNLIIGKHVKNISNNNNVNVGYARINRIFGIGSLFSLNKITEYLIEEITVNYSEDEAIRYAKSKIIYDFNLTKLNEQECIESIDFVSINECEDVYEVSFMVKYIRNFCEFKKKV